MQSTQPFTFFVSYRREDTAPIALLLKNEIEKRMQFVRVVVDVNDVEPGERVSERVRSLIANAHSTIALISKRWMPRVGEAPTRQPSEWVVGELELSVKTPLAMMEPDRYKLKERYIFPLFVDCERTFAQFTIPESIAYLADRNAEYIDYAGWPNAIGPLIDRIAEALDRKKRPDADQYPEPDQAKARTQPLADAELASILGYDDYAGWYIDNFGNAEVRYLVKTFKFPHFNHAADFMALVSSHCRVLDHHPEWRNVFNHVTVSLTTWDARRRVTIYDLNLALYMNKAAEVASQGNVKK